MRVRVVTALLPLVTASLLAGGPAASAQAAPGLTTAPLRVMPLGDSITWGYQSSTGNGYRDRLWQDLTRENHPLDLVGSGRGGSMSDPDNEGHSGWRIDQVAGIADSVLAQYKPNVVTLEIGTNDLNQAYQVSSAPARLSALVAQIVRDDPGATVLVASLIASTNPVENADWATYNAAIPGIVQAEQAAGKHVAYVSMSAVTTADLFDALHPNDTGYAKMGDAFNAAIQAAADGISAPVPNGAAIAGSTGAVASAIAGKCLDDNASSNADGTHIQIWSCNGTGAQSWTAYNDGSLRVLGKCLDATKSGLSNGTLIQLFDCNRTGAQLWQSYSGGYRNPESGRCLDVPGSSATDGTQLQLWDCNGTNAQRWATLQRN